MSNVLKNLIIRVLKQQFFFFEILKLIVLERMKNLILQVLFLQLRLNFANFFQLLLLQKVVHYLLSLLFHGLLIHRSYLRLDSFVQQDFLVLFIHFMMFFVINLFDVVFDEVIFIFFLKSFVPLFLFNDHLLFKLL